MTTQNDATTSKRVQVGDLLICKSTGDTFRHVEMTESSYGTHNIARLQHVNSKHYFRCVAEHVLFDLFRWA